MKRTIEEIIAYDSESALLDFKEKQYVLGADGSRNEFLKDLSAFANHPSDDDKIIAIGIKEEGGIASAFIGVSELVDEAAFQQIVESNVEPKVNFELIRFVHKGVQLAYFRIFNNDLRPYLFKRDLPTSSGKKEYRTGDGFIKHGSATRKLNREDLEAIYKKRYSSKDRKGDLQLEAFIADVNDDELSQYNLYALEMSIQNTSTRSIDFEVDLKVFTNEEVRIVTDRDLKIEMQENENERRQQAGLDVPIHLHIMPPISFDLNTEYLEGCLIASRTKRIGERASVSIPQHAKEEFIFQRALIILADRGATIKGEVTIRSDDFPDGPLVWPFTLTFDK